eukprot:CAMPEP_0185573062 /NCGR_PEP_ID=MMETSP0434-20130131/4871_1 /TAXON_ID=626734 ORGANISM="Favella taraikaensis, Strain Fe Narragansett Bay" /NCGR_SAMPLE_ID=MMETSP0434 /ASSEMBLY_ACC=CAM_ASM_000379 /LENGTH=30 /DNA_ID= /DNA_START= /DNA_END= /DNA_ORIENTATION=
MRLIGEEMARHTLLDLIKQVRFIPLPAMPK